MTKLNWDAARLRDRLRRQRASMPHPVPYYPEPIGEDDEPASLLVAAVDRILDGNALLEMQLTLAVWSNDFVVLCLLAYWQSHNEPSAPPVLSPEDGARVASILDALNRMQDAGQELDMALKAVRP